LNVLAANEIGQIILTSLGLLRLFTESIIICFSKGVIPGSSLSL